MNKIRRKKIIEIKNILEQQKNLIESIQDDEQDYFDNMPENLQGSMRGSDSEDAIDSLSNAFDSLEAAIDSLEEIQ